MSEIMSNPYAMGAAEIAGLMTSKNLERSWGRLSAVDEPAIKGQQKKNGIRIGKPPLPPFNNPPGWRGLQPIARGWRLRQLLRGQRWGSFGLKAS
jgi:hypothetical protein